MRLRTMSYNNNLYKLCLKNINMTGNNENFVIGLIFAVCGLSAGYGLGCAAYSPDRAYEIDVNRDRRKDIITKSNSGKMEIFLRQEDGKLLREDYNNEIMKNNAKSMLEKEIESNSYKKN